MDRDAETQVSEPEFLKAAEAGKLIGVSAWTIYQLRASGRLKSFSVAGSSALRFARADVLALMTPAAPRSQRSA